MMMRRVIMMTLAVVTAGLTFTMVQNLNAQSSKTAVATAQEPQGPYVLVASKTLPAGTFITSDIVKWQPWPKGSLPESYMTKDKHKIEDLSGAVVRRALSAGEPVTQERLIKPGDRGFVAAILKDGMRAVSVQVNAQSGIAGLVFPGDQVDVLLTHAVTQVDDQTRPVKQVTETILQNVRVLAMDQKTDDVANKPTVPKTATLEVSPKQAEILMVADQLGRLSLSLRSLSDSNIHDDTVPVTFTMDGEASQLLSAEHSTKQIVIVRGSEAQSVSVGSAPVNTNPTNTASVQVAQP